MSLPCVFNVETCLVGFPDDGNYLVYFSVLYLGHVGWSGMSGYSTQQFRLGLLVLLMSKVYYQVCEHVPSEKLLRQDLVMTAKISTHICNFTDTAQRSDVQWLNHTDSDGLQSK